MQQQYSLVHPAKYVSHRSIFPIFGCAFYWLCLALTCCLTFGINYGIDYGMHKNEDMVAVINGTSFIANVIITLLIIDVLCFFGGGSIRDRILQGDAQPVAQLALCDTLLKRIIFFSMAEPRWKVRFPRFVAQTCLFPGLFVVLVVYAICWFASGCGTLPKDACVVPLKEWCAWTELWKVCIASSVYTVNYISMHNDAQPELYPETAQVTSSQVPAEGVPTSNYRTAAQV
jgi:hypothetical protein